MSEQYSQEWVQERLGKVTASRISDVVARTKSGWGASRANYMTQLIIERLTGQPMDTYQNEAMRHGITLEPEAVTAYEFMHDITTTPCGFFTHPEIVMSGASPDRIIGERGLLEVKCPNSATHMETLLSGTVPDKYLKQMQWQMACTGREWVDFVSYDCRMPPDMRLFRKHVTRDSREISLLEHAVKEFLHELESKLTALRSRYRGSQLKQQLSASLAEETA